ncbi:hypothetical protein L1049_014825 [Liquidambar formosana]|uniref:Uncharacterized protein n=1 Tax=Liquidambar formosana TaxID=63359 RepID=A0AAP0RWN5_LIQFO
MYEGDESMGRIVAIVLFPTVADGGVSNQTHLASTKGLMLMGTSARMMREEENSGDESDWVDLMVTVVANLMGIAIAGVDGFTDSAFKGNPAAVCLLEEEGEEKWLQAVAREFNISKTCYLTRITESETHPYSPNGTLTPRFRLRWFTPGAELGKMIHAFNIHSLTLVTTQACGALWEDLGWFSWFKSLRPYIRHLKEKGCL